MPCPHKNITDTFRQVYLPKKALLIYEHLLDEQNIYIESYDCSETGKLINAHPLSVKEIEALADILQRGRRQKERYLLPDGLLPQNLLYLNAERKCAVWHTAQQTAQLYFTKTLGLPDGKMQLPALIWKATDTELSVFAINTPIKPSADTALYYAPFFNTYSDGKICMGTVEIEIEDCENLNQFIRTWQEYFFQSHFSHTLESHKITRTPLEKLYRELLNTSQRFPEKELIKTRKTLQNILP